MKATKSSTRADIVEPKRALHTYGVYGVSIHSEIPLALPEYSGGPLTEIELRLKPAAWFEEATEGAEPVESASWYEYSRLGDGSSYASWDGVGEFLVSADGKTIFCRQFVKSAKESFQVYLLGQAVSFGLVKQGLEPLHATAVEVKGQAAVFLGGGGAGKSTLAASFIQLGHRLLTDDLLLLKETADGVVVGYPGPPRLKLFPALAKKFLGKQARGARMNPFTRKMILPLAQSQVYKDPLPLGAIYSIDQRQTGSSETISIEPLSQREAFLELVKHTFNRRALDSDRLERNFNANVRWANRGLVRRLCYPRHLVRLSEVQEAIQWDLESSNKKRAVS